MWLEKPSSSHAEGLKNQNKHPAESIEAESPELTIPVLPIAHPGHQPDLI